VAFVRSEADPPPALAHVFEAEREADRREELNALYVALTRARTRLVVSAHQPFRAERQESWWNRLVSCPTLATQEPWQPPCRAETQEDSGEAPPAARLRVLPAPPALALASRSGVAVDAPSSVIEDEERDQSVAHFKTLGQVVHRGLEWLTTFPVAMRDPDRVTRAVHAAAQALQLPSAHWRDAVQRVSTILAQPELSQWLDPDALSWAGNEVALSDEGDLLRIDRLVCQQTPEGPVWWVIDYKLGEQPLAMAAYHAQMARYVAAVRRLQPGESVQGAFITGSGQWVPWREP
jgi:ATP-dependent helicase/nuclease subunit A